MSETQTKARPYRYDALLAGDIETRWQGEWEDRQTFRQPNPGEPGFDASKPKFYCLDMFPYPSGAGLHVGHPEGYTATDIICRFKRMTGHNVLHPMGWDAFGLPAEQYAIQTGIHPAETTLKSIDNFRRQLKRFGFCYDWSREFGTIDEDYYKWTQWIFLRLYDSWYDEEAGEYGKARPINELIEELTSERILVGPSGDIERRGASIATDALSPEPVGLRSFNELTAEEQRAVIDNQRLAYLSEQTVNWCPKLGTALANEEVIDGFSERGHFPVFRKPLKQWMLRITAYAERLLRGLDEVDWPESTKTMQSTWIGRSEGAEIDFALCGGTALRAASGNERADPDHSSESCATHDFLRVYTTRPDTIFGATYMVVAPEHPLVDAALADPPERMDEAAVREYVAAARNRTDVERQESKEKTGAWLGIEAVNPATGDRIPVWVADYVLMGYGHGAIMAVPAGDDRDYEFAEVFDLPIVDVVYPRHVMAMAYLSRHATKDERDSATWRSVMADFVGYVTSMEIAPEKFATALDVVRARRAIKAHAPEAQDLDVNPGEAGQPGGRRGVVKMAWLDAIAEIGVTTLDALREVFDAKSFQKHAGEPYVGPGFGVNSANDGVSLDGLTVNVAKKRIVEWLEDQGYGNRKINFKLRDWLFSRQRYWGEPFPIVFDESGNHHAVSESALPVTLPPLADYEPVESDDPQPLLAKATDWLVSTAGEAGVDDLPPETPVRREANTMPGWAGSCWYFLRYCDPHDAERLVSEDAERYWMTGRAPNDTPRGPVPPGGVDLYIGGAEHAVLHLLYARFWHKVLFDLGEVSTDEPFRKLFHQGLITSFAFQRPDKTLVPVDEVDEQDEGTFIERATGKPVAQITAKMSKSLKNVVNPDEVVADYGADTFRLYEMYMGPLEASKPWNTRDIIGLFRFLQRAWRLCVDEDTGEVAAVDAADEGVERALHKTIAKVGHDIEAISLNTAIASMIELVNAATSAGGMTRDQLERFARVLSPFAPHMAEEMWSRLGHETLVADASWPSYDEAMLIEDQIEIPVQIKGKVRAKIMVSADADQDAIQATALADEKVQGYLDGKEPRKVIVVPGKLVNIVPG